MKRIPLIVAFILFVLFCVSSSYWVMRLIKPDTRKKVLVQQVAKPVADVESVAKLFGGVMLVDTNYQLKGVIQANPMDQSVAVISIDGSPMKAYPVDSEVTSGSAVGEVFSNYVLLKDHGVTKRVELPQDKIGRQAIEILQPPVSSPPGKEPDRNIKRSETSTGPIGMKPLYPSLTLGNHTSR